MTKNNTIILAGLACVAVAGCAPQPIIPNPQTIIYKSSAAKIRNAVTRVCDENQLNIEQQTDTSVLCSAAANAGAQMVYGFQYGSGVTVKYKFTWFSLEDGIKVTGNSWFESQNAYGMTKQNTAPQLKTWAQSALDTVKERLEGGNK